MINLTQQQNIKPVISLNDKVMNLGKKLKEYGVFKQLVVKNEKGHYVLEGELLNHETIVALGNLTAHKHYHAKIEKVGSKVPGGKLEYTARFEATAETFKEIWKIEIVPEMIAQISEKQLVPKERKSDKGTEVVVLGLLKDLEGLKRYLIGLTTEKHVEKMEKFTIDKDKTVEVVETKEVKTTEKNK